VLSTVGCKSVLSDFCSWAGKVAPLKTIYLALSKFVKLFCKLLRFVVT